eukprot:CAMPEP_0206422892 /NCGR_PEP_ID=MMETSP0324_2-20121206/2359_1 /ASSEMBLY_ACC=CAM_ASM_000836 /TAXON_ID=2866 /ORGANISM="Crypthecodinium cohnii, Strain Seligo" /LENGTH=240 /DNA_ID=CAMNT_0053887355 /DNA_START=28 /DNA_END=753 /DNA_ORIENTATION=-
MSLQHCDWVGAAQEEAPKRSSTARKTPAHNEEVASIALGDARAPVYCIDDDEGRRLLSAMQPTGTAAFQRWKASYEAQLHGSFCAPASVAMAMRFVGADPAEADQKRLYNEVIVPNRLMTMGVSYAQGAALARAVGFAVEECSTYDEAALTDALLQDLKEAFLQGSHLCLLVNYWRPTGGHWCPIAAWSEEHVLLLDPQPKRLPPHWVPVAGLVKSLCLHNRITGKPRGYLRLRLPEVAN